MSGSSTLTFVVVLLLGLMVFQARLWFVLLCWFRRQAEQVTAEVGGKASGR